MASMHRRSNSEALRFVRDAELSDLSDPEFLELDGLDPRQQAVAFDASADAPPEPQEPPEKRTKRAFPRALYVRAGVSLLSWYAFSISLSVYNKHMFSAEGMDFRFPVLLTSFHQFTQIVLAVAALGVLRVPMHHAMASEKYKVIPAGLASAADIGLGNTSLLIVTLSFYTMIKSSALGFVLLFSILFRLESPTWRLALIVCVMTVGVFLMVAGEANFNLVGFFFVLGASCASGLRWSLVKLLLSDTSRPPLASAAPPDIRVSPASPSFASPTHMPHMPPPPSPPTPLQQQHQPPLPAAAAEVASRGKPHPVQTILSLSPVMFVTLFVWGAIQEGLPALAKAPFWTRQPLPLGIIYILIPGVLAFAMTWAEYDLLGVTGPLTLAVAGICKEVATIVTSVLVFHDRLSAVNALGLGVTILSIGLYHYYRTS